MSCHQTGSYEQSTVYRVTQKQKAVLSLSAGKIHNTHIYGSCSVNPTQNSTQKKSMKVLDTFLHRVLINLAVSLWWWEDFLRSQIDFRLSSSGSFFLLRIQISFLINRVFKTTNSNNCSNKILWSQSSSVGWQGNQLWGWSRVIASQPDQDATKSQENKKKSAINLKNDKS